MYIRYCKWCDREVQPYKIGDTEYCPYCDMRVENPSRGYAAQGNPRRWRNGL